MDIAQFQGIEAVQALGARMLNRTPSRRCLMYGSPLFTSGRAPRRVTAS